MNPEFLKLLNSDIDALEQTRTDAIAQANYRAGYLAGQIDAKKQMRDALLAPAASTESEDAVTDEAAKQPENPPSAPVIRTAPPLTRKEERRLKALERKAISSNGHSTEPLPSGAS